MEIDYTQLKPYIITLSRISPAIKDYSKFIQAGVSGVTIEAGYLFDSQHKHQTVFRNPKAYEQAEKALSSGLPIGWMMPARARNVTEASEEIYQMSFEIRKYSPMLGAWLLLELKGSISDNDTILDRYKEELHRLGLQNKIGLICTYTSLKTITWSQKQADWSLWIIDPVNNLSELNSLLEPSFFDTEGKYV